MMFEITLLGGEIGSGPTILMMMIFAMILWDKRNARRESRLERKRKGQDHVD